MAHFTRVTITNLQRAGKRIWVPDFSSISRITIGVPSAGKLRNNHLFDIYIFQNC